MPEVNVYLLLEYLWHWLARWCCPDEALRLSVPPPVPHW